MATEANIRAMTDRIIKMLENPHVRAANAPARDLRAKIYRLADELAKLQADCGYRSFENALAIAQTVKELEEKLNERKVIDDGKRSLRTFLLLFAALWAKGFVDSGAPIYLIGALLTGHLWARWRI